MRKDFAMDGIHPEFEEEYRTLVEIIRGIAQDDRVAANYNLKEALGRVGNLFRELSIEKTNLATALRQDIQMQSPLQMETGHAHAYHRIYIAAQRAIAVEAVTAQLREAVEALDRLSDPSEADA